VCPWRLALQKEGWRQQMDEIRAVRTVAQLLFALSRSQKWGQKPAPKTGPQYYRKKERLPKWRPHFWDQGVAYTVSPPLRAVSSGDPGTFRLFLWRWAWQSLIQVLQYIYIHSIQIQRYPVLSKNDWLRNHSMPITIQRTMKLPSLFFSCNCLVAVRLKLPAAKRVFLTFDPQIL
jgi:hypothetical protein